MLLETFNLHCKAVFQLKMEVVREYLAAKGKSLSESERDFLNNLDARTSYVVHGEHKHSYLERVKMLVLVIQDIQDLQKEIVIEQASQK